MDPSQLPPGAAQALQQSGLGGDNLTQILAQLATMSPDEVSAALAQLGINVDPNTLHGMAEKWVDESADKLSSGSADGEQQPTAAADEGDEESPSPAESASAAPTRDEEDLEPEPDNEQAEGENAMAAASPEDVASAQQAQSGGMAMANRGNAGGNMDAAISAMMGASGGARGAPTRLGAPRPSAMPMPGPAPGEDPRAKSMIANIYRQQMGPGSGAASSRIGIPLGPRTGGGPNETSSPLTRMKKPKKQ